ncbi:pyruvate formate lyase-activating protein [Spirochaetia bacterium]|nr:pyruvate formate lyase-activating protein [Spirochaetia bacterium]
MRKPLDIPKGLVFDIQKFSLNDGGGIRTVVFLKGCPLRCAWCSNPESQDSTLQRIYWKKKCVGCGACAKVCPEGKGCLKPGYITCKDKCQKCVDVCPAGALKGTAKIYEVDELVNVLSQDRRFYYRSGGGVTFSGGESLLQYDFVRAVSISLKAMLINTAIETCAYAPWEKLWTACEHIDTILFDIKSLDNDIHTKYTGKDNTLILDNLEKLSGKSKALIIRIPVIKDLNDSEEHIRQIIELAKKNNIKKIHLLPYHALGKPKYEGLGYNFTSFERPGDEHLNTLVNIIQDAGLKALVGG